MSDMEDVICSDCGSPITADDWAADRFYTVDDHDPDEPDGPTPDDPDYICASCAGADLVLNNGRTR